MTERERTLNVVFESDWHIGSGAGIPGSVDRQVLRDRDGLPYVSGKTLTGILRDAAEWVAETRDRIESGDRWGSAMRALFGSQKEGGWAASEALLGIGSAEFSREVADALRANDDIRRALFVVRPGIKIASKTGRTEEKHLFSTEEVRGGCTLSAQIGFKQELEPDQEKLLNDAVKAVRRIGGKRRRGGGKCRLELSPDKKSEVYTGNHTKKLPDADGKDVLLDFRLKTLQPVIVNRVTLGNVVKSDSTIPGVTLLPYLTRKVLGAGGDKEWQERIQRAVMNGEFSVGSFLPEFDGHIASPVPLSFAQPKGASSGIINRVVTPADDSVQWKDLRSGYIFEAEDRKLFYAHSDELFVLRTHNTVDDKKQRPTEDVGGLFTYQAIREGATFRGTVRVSAQFWKEIREKLPPEKLKSLESGLTSIGQSRKDEYGRVQLEYLGLAEPEALPELVDGKYLVVYMASDVLFRDEQQAYTADPEVMRTGLQAVLDVELEPLNWGDDEPVSPLGGDRGHCLRSGRRESWHTRWGLPRPSFVYLQAGSLCVFEVKNPERWDPQKARQVETEGFGGRRAEGYGRLRFNPRFGVERGLEIGVYEKNKELENQEKKTPAIDDPFFLLLKDEAWKWRFCRDIRRIIYDEIPKILDKERKRERPATSQFGALREAASSISEGEDGLEIFNKWLGSKFAQGEAEAKSVAKRWNDEWRSFVLGAVTSIGKISLDGKYNVNDVSGNFKKILDSAKEAMGDDAPDNLHRFALRTLLDVFCEAVFDRDKKSGSLEGR